MLKKKDFYERVATRMEFIPLKGVYNNVGEPIKKARASARLARQTLQAAFEVIQRDLLAEQKITIGDIAVVKLINRQARLARNPRTGEQVQVPAKAALKIKPTNKLKKSILPAKKKVATVQSQPTPVQPSVTNTTTPVQLSVTDTTP